MRFQIRHEVRGRIRIHMMQPRMNYEQADTLLYYLQQLSGVTEAKVYERTQDAVIYYTGTRRELLRAVQSFSYEGTKVPEEVLANSGRRMNADYQEKLVMKVAAHYMRRLFLPAPLGAMITALRSVRYIREGVRTLLRGRIEVPVLDAAAVGVSVLRGDMKTAGSVMFLLGIGELLEEWTHKKSVGDLARTLSLNVDQVWLKQEDREILVPAGQIRQEDRIVVRAGSLIPFDGAVEEGEAMVNQASLTGESLPVRRAEGASVYAGTVVEEGELVVRVLRVGGATRYEKVVAMIEESEKLKSVLESRAEHLADRLVPYTLAGTGLTYLFTRNVTKALSVLMVDFSCALKLSMPIAVLSAIREAGLHHITVKGGRFLEQVAEADTIVFDKTGTLTKAEPTVARVISFNGESEDELLRLAACMEEHFPHSMAKAVVDAARERGLDHEEMHSKVEYLVAHGISTTVEGRKAVIGSYHFVFEDEGCRIPEGMEQRFRELPAEYSHLYLAIENTLAAVICIEDPLREEAADVIRRLRRAGFHKLVMMTGDSERTACAIARTVGVDEYYSEVLPEDKASFVEREKAAGRKVIMVGDGINDSPALSAADVGIAIRDGARIASEIADITLGAEDLYELVTLKQLSKCLMERIRRNYRSIVGINAGLILLGVCGVIAPTTSALLHNTSTVVIALQSMRNLLTDEKTISITALTDPT